MKLFKYKKILAFLCALILLFVLLCFPASASSTFLVDSVSQPYFTPGHIAFNFKVNNFYDPSTYYVSHSFDPILGNFFDITYRDDLNDQEIINIDQSVNTLYAYFPNDEILFNSSRSDLTVLDNGSLSGLASFSYSTYFEIDPNTYRSGPSLSSIIISDFYCWNNDDLYEFTCETVLYIQNFSSLASILSIDVVYRDVGTSELLSTSLSSSDVPRFSNGDFEIRPENIDGNSLEDAVYYVDSLVITIDSDDFLEYNFLGYFNYIFYPGLKKYDLDQASPTFDDNPAFSLAPYTSWLANAVSGFMDFQIYHNFTLGGIFMTIIAFACCVWFLKLVAGG